MREMTKVKAAEEVSAETQERQEPAGSANIPHPRALQQTPGKRNMGGGNLGEDLEEIDKAKHK